MPAVSFRPHAENYKFLLTIANRNAFMQQLLDLARTGQLNIEIHNTEHETIVRKIKKEKDSLEVQKMITGINRQNQAIEESKARARYIALKADYLATFQKPMSISATRYLKPVTREPTINQTLSCTQCNELFRYSDGETLAAQKDALSDHFFQRHGAMPAALIEELRNVRIET